MLIVGLPNKRIYFWALVVIGIIITVTCLVFIENQKICVLPAYIKWSYQSTVVVQDLTTSFSFVSVRTPTTDGRGSAKSFTVQSRNPFSSIKLRDPLGHLNKDSLQNKTVYANNVTYITQRVTSESDIENNTEEVLPRKSKFKIVMYHAFHGGLRSHFREANIQNCHYYKNCELSFHRPVSTTPIYADAILLQGNHMPKMVPTRLNKDQVFVFLNVESPQYLQQTNLANPKFTRYINWTMTYRLDSDIPYLYGTVIPRQYNKTQYLIDTERTGFTVKDNIFNNYIEEVSKKPIGIQGKRYSEIFSQKDNVTAAVWLVSHCVTASRRENFVGQLQQFVNVDIIGRCTSSRQSCPRNAADCDENIVRSYKFYLAFENSLCKDYITEKAFHWYNKDIILVTRGALEYSKYLPKGTYIDAENFQTPEELGAYLTHLANNENEYLNILKLKDMFMSLSDKTTHQLSFCHLCYRLNNLERFRTSIVSIKEWWSYGTCKKPTRNVLSVSPAFR